MNKYVNVKIENGYLKKTFLKTSSIKLKSEIRNPKSEIKTSLPVMEHFYTLQGEGFHQGRAAYFIRLGGCDIGCVWCDVKDSWDTGKHPLRSIDYLMSEIKKTSAEIVVITGCEP